MKDTNQCVGKHQTLNGQSIHDALHHILLHTRSTQINKTNTADYTANNDIIKQINCYSASTLCIRLVRLRTQCTAKVLRVLVVLWVHNLFTRVNSNTVANNKNYSCKNASLGLTVTSHLVHLLPEKHEKNTQCFVTYSVAFGAKIQK